jgi:cobalamin biosynthesis Mg chelatase CobN
MRKISSLLFVLVLGCTMTFAQANTPQSTQDNSQTPVTAPRTTHGDRNASQVDRGVPANQNSPKHEHAAGQNSAPATTPAQTPTENPTATDDSAATQNQSSTQRAATHGGGVPWGWIIVGIIVIAIILALIGRGGNDRVVTRETERDRTLGPTGVDDRRVDKRDDDIRRVG